MNHSRFEIKAGDLLDALHHHGFTAVVEQTGGSTATIRATKDGHVLLAGPGFYDWAEPRDSLFHTGDLWVGPQSDDADKAVAVKTGATAAEVAALFVKAGG